MACRYGGACSQEAAQELCLGHVREFCEQEVAARMGTVAIGLQEGVQ